MNGVGIGNPEERIGQISKDQFHLNSTSVFLAPNFPRLGAGKEDIGEREYHKQDILEGYQRHKDHVGNNANAYPLVPSRETFKFPKSYQDRQVKQGQEKSIDNHS